MKKILIALMMVCLVGAFCVKASAQEAATPAPKAAKEKAPAVPPMKMAGDITVVDTKLCTLSVKDTSGEKTFKASLKKLATLKVGEKVTVTYVEIKKGRLKATSIITEKKVAAQAKKAEKQASKAAKGVK